MQAGRRCRAGDPGGSVPVTLRARPPPCSGTVHGLKLPARVAARIQGSQIALGWPRVGGAGEREREAASTPGCRPGPEATGGAAAPTRAAEREDRAGSPHGPGQLCATGQTGPPHTWAGISEATWPSASSAALSCAARHLQEAHQGPCLSVTSFPLARATLSLPRAEETPGQGEMAWVQHLGGARISKEGKEGAAR